MTYLGIKEVDQRSILSDLNLGAFFFHIRSLANTHKGLPLSLVNDTAYLTRKGGVDDRQFGSGVKKHGGFSLLIFTCFDLFEPFDWGMIL